MLGLVRHVRAEVAADDAVPGRVVLFVELLLDVGGDVLLDVELLEGLGGAVDGVLLHVLRHVCIFDNSLSFSLVWWEGAGEHGSRTTTKNEKKTNAA